MNDKLRIVVVDDHPLFREGVIYTLKAEPDFEVVGEGATAADALRLVSSLSPDILLLDIGIPGGGANAVQTIAAASPATKTVILTASESADDMLMAMKAGVLSYVLKGIPVGELIGVLRAVRAGQPYVAPSLAARLITEMTGAPVAQPANPLDELTAREHEILEQVAAGRSNKEIAYQLHLTEKTVKNYMTTILQKLQVRNRVEAALLAQREKQNR